MKNGTVELEDPQNPEYLYASILCEACSLEHRLRIPYTKGIGVVKYVCSDKELFCDYPLAWSPHQDSKTFIIAEVIG